MTPSEQGAAPEVTTMVFFGVAYKVNLRVIRTRMVEIQTGIVEVECANAPTRGGIHGMAQRCGVSHMTLRRLLAGGSISLESLHVVCSRLGLAFDEVCDMSTAYEVAV